MDGVSGLNHITLAVRDAGRAFDFYTGVLGCRALARWPEGAYLLAGDVWLALIQDAAAHPRRDYTHIAFSAAPGAFDKLCARIREAGARIWQENRTEGDSLYFLDPDGHKLELHASDLETRLAHARAHPWEDLEFFV